MAPFVSGATPKRLRQSKFEFYVADSFMNDRIFREGKKIANPSSPSAKAFHYFMALLAVQLSIYWSNQIGICLAINRVISILKAFSLAQKRFAKATFYHSVFVRENNLRQKVWLDSFNLRIKVQMRRNLGVILIGVESLQFLLHLVNVCCRRRLSIKFVPRFQPAASPKNFPTTSRFLGPDRGLED